MQKVRAEIRLNNVKNNAKRFRERTGVKLCAVVKANAYGHGAEEIVNALSSVADCFAVALIEEAICIRTVALTKDVLVFTPPLTEEDCYALAANGFIATVSDLWTAKLLHRVCAKYRLSVKAHLKVNTGMNRYGMNISSLGKVSRFLQRSPWVQVAGIYSHLYTTDFQTSEMQRLRFCQACEVCRRYFPDVTAHLSATYGSLLGEKFAFDMTRVGLGLYGYLPALSENSGVLAEPALEKAMTVYAAAVVNRKPANGGLGYGLQCKAEDLGAKKEVCVCRFGYADGVLRKRENGVENWEKNLNDMCMDACIRQGYMRRGERFPILTDAEQTAKLTGTIAYEVLCAATARAEFVYEEY